MLVLGDILRRQAAVRGGKAAYVVGGDRLTYAEFHARANQLGRALQRLGVGRGDRVAVLANNCIEYPLVYFGVLALGAIVVPINARFGADEVAALVGHSEAATFLFAGEFAPLVSELRLAGRLPAVRHFISIDGRGAADASLGDLAGGEASDDLEVEIDERDPHVMLYTSGTTGSAKGTLLSHRSYYLQAVTSHLQLGFSEDDIALSMFPMFHMGGWALPLGFWHTGGTAVIMPKADPRSMLEAIERERVTYLYAVPTVYRSLLALPDFERFDLASLRLLGGGTAAMTAAQVREIRERFRCPHMVIVYGSTEAGPISAVRPAEVERKSETVGRPYLDVEVKLLDEDGSEVAAGAVGEIAVRSEFTMTAYWRNPEETERTLRNGWVHTGDLGAFDAEGFLSIVGRRKEVIRSGGESIFPVEIERVLLGHAAVREVSVLGVPDPHWGEAVAAVIVRRDGANLGAEEVIDYLKERLASYKKPRHVVFLSQLPRTASSQQVHKSLLREMVLEQLAK
jgi:acyl-CoA synthetase (AMP-forming)/AMP-acid ligase II